MSVKATRDEKPSTSSSIVGCCQSSSTTPENSIVDYIEEDLEAPNNNTLFHASDALDNVNSEKVASATAAAVIDIIAKKKASIDFTFPKRPKVDIEFQNVKYTVKKFSFQNRQFEKKEILHDVSGAFRSGQLTAIMGPSGAGKSTLLNILAGYVETGVTGKITINGKSRSSNSENFRNVSAYIHQDDALRPYLTVCEAMTYSADLKLGFKITKEYKLQLIHSILELLGLETRFNTKCGQLSGGQKKRMSIALELISNPSVIFLDEPTTGLDSSSCTSCISLLKRLAQEGRTIVCTIHQPSALVFEMFDKLYAVTQGNCIYQGPIKELVPFMSDHGLECPSYHNPADFLIEVAVGEYDVNLSKLMAAAVKKYHEERDTYYLGTYKRDNFIRADSGGSFDGGKVAVYKFNTMDNNNEEMNVKRYRISRGSKDDGTKFRIKNQSERASVLMQFLVLFDRNFKASIRNAFLIYARILSHLCIAPMFGYLYHNVGYDATHTFGNYVYLYGSILLIIYTGKMSVVLSFPLEMETLRREHFNRWYNLIPYYFSIILFEIPFQLFCTFLYVCGSYFLTGNYVAGEPHRFIIFTIMCLLATISAQSWGFFIGSTMPIKIAVFIGPILAVLFSVFGFCTRYVDINRMFQWMWHISYFRAGFHGVLDTVYGMNRSDLWCPPDTKFNYCHFRKPAVFLREVSINGFETYHNICLMSGVIITMHILTIFTLYFKLNKR
ncbi:ATP-binding cassette sub-family G member 1 [Sitodiplosis mosellana]|uniref:ATP-binding cassette sub-family G member 1 n=1 Tax=Sitodiplosis mosellana TaxID=263140 RepID=UPI002443FCD8|nr:ATP-binding cassette sub-family G member 1 [Sitodiplosis mosellana]XP_055314836.1 ATP-binding cassette sub-family G member 1 [Sitodiplosis mosellana]XP_055314845.1 ATP-binding cassette sub-family G member 1 [Sitodiplosis mosellana]XP_055314853.1 ATP-binding cassette sub-family G member 1 [Sitodiplosis mosellana]